LQTKFAGGKFYSAYEAGFCGTGYHEQLCKVGISNIIVHAADIPQTDKQKKNKTDLHDSRSIAEYLEKGNLHGIHVLCREQQELRSLFRLREGAVKDVTRSNNRLKSFMLYYNIEIPETVRVTCYLSKKALEWLGNLELSSPAGTLTKENLIQQLQHQRTRLGNITRLLRKQMQTQHAKAYELLLSVPGYGPITAAALLAETGSFERFDDPNDYTGYLGIMPWNESSGETVRTKGIQPRCNTHLRPLLIEAAWAAVRTAPEIFAYYSKHAAKDNKHAIVKVARKLALIARGVVLKGEKYQADYLQKKQQGKQKQGNGSQKPAP
jgi:transposase